VIVTTVTELLSANASSLFLVDPVTNELIVSVATGPVSTDLKEMRLKMGQGIAGWVAEQRKGVIVNDVGHDPRFYANVDRSTGFTTKSILAVPLLDQERVLGVLEVLNTSKPKRFDQADLDLLTAYASHAAVALKNAQLFSVIREEKRLLQISLDERYRTFIVESPAMRKVVETAEKAAKSQATILLLGESGVGKEILARSIHVWSPRATKSFVAVNCVALSDHLLESELFGHEKGAFTGATQQKKGLLEVAQGGTIFLDEIGDMKPDLQAKLLRVLQDHEFERVGGTQPIRVDIRVIAATNQDLKTAVRDKRFRKDLFFRLNVVGITIPPLRERRDDIPALAQFFLARYSKDVKRPPMAIDPAAMKLLREYDWPGNVRELGNVIERAVVLAAEEILHPADFVLEVLDTADNPAGQLMFLPFHHSVEEFKRLRLQEAIAKAGGSKIKAAKALELQPTYLSRLCKQMGVA
jgi:Nif-specific regulatory protein